MTRAQLSLRLANREGGASAGPTGRQWLSETLLTHPPLPDPTAGTTDVSTEAQWVTAWNTVGPGERIRLTADITTTAREELTAVGTSSDPIIVDTNGFKIVAGNDSPFHIFNSSWLFIRAHIDGNSNAVWAFSASERFQGDSAGIGPCDNIHWYGCTIEDPDQTGMKVPYVTGGEIIGCDISGMGQRAWQDNEYNRGAEGIYLGQGNLVNGVRVGGSEDILIENTHVHDTHSGGNNIAGEGIDVKAGCKNITIRRCLIENIKLASQGALTFALNQIGEPDFGGDGVNGLIEENVIRDNYVPDWPNGGDDGQGGTVHRADGLVIATGQTIARNNLVYGNTDGAGITEVQNFKHNKVLHLLNNTSYGNADGGILQRGTAGEGSSLPATKTIQGNLSDQAILSDGSGGQNIANATAADFVGPLTTQQGFEPSATSTALDYGNTTITTDATGETAVGARDAGALERI